MLRIGVDVGGTNTDAVVMDAETVISGTKSPTTNDILSGVENSILSALTQANKKPDDIQALIIGTTHFVNAIVQRKNLAKTGLIRLSLPSGGSILPFADWPKELVDSINGNFKLVKGGFEMDGSEISKLDKKLLTSLILFDISYSKDVLIPLELNLIKDLGYDPNLEKFNKNNLSSDIIKIKIDGFNYEVPSYLIYKKVPDKLTNQLIKKSLNFTRNIIQNRFFSPHNIPFPKSRVLLENYFN